jgi:hypothetical protein
LGFFLSKERLAVTMAKSFVRPRRSFGGSHGVWWRNKKSVALTPSEESPSSSSTVEDQKKETEAIGWDEDLCRPIYPVSKQTSDSKVVINECNDYVNPPKPPLKRLLSDAPIKRSKTFGKKRRIPVSFLLLEANQESVSSPSSTSCSSEDNSASSFPKADNDTSFENSYNNSNNNQESSSLTLEFSERDEKPAKKRKIVSQEQASLLKAKQYFQQLDSTQTLTLDSSDSPIKTSQVTRTSRKVNLTSPGITREYKAYAHSSQGSGVSPLSIQKYAHSRREYFRRTELFDGFFDEL